NLREQLVRFVLGGAVTVAAGVIARGWGGVIGGVFFAFSAVFPAGGALIEQPGGKRQRGGGRGGRRGGRCAGAVGAVGAACGGAGAGAVQWAEADGSGRACP